MNLRLRADVRPRRHGSADTEIAKALADLLHELDAFDRTNDFSRLRLVSAIETLIDTKIKGRP